MVEYYEKCIKICHILNEYVKKYQTELFGKCILGSMKKERLVQKNEGTKNT